MNVTLALQVHAIETARLDAMRRAGTDHRGNQLTPFPAEGWEPLRCCLSFPEPDEPIALISYNPFATVSPWAETGPIYIHPEECSGYPNGAELPPRMRTGPKLLRTYHSDGTLAYDHITMVPDGDDLEAPLRELLRRDDVAVVHVRAALSQCFGYAVTRG